MERPTAAKTAAEREKHGPCSVSFVVIPTESRLGLIIISAHYGLASVFTSRGMKEHEGDEEVVIDVTVPVQALVMNSRIYVPGGRAKVGSSIPRCVYEPKQSQMFVVQLARFLGGSTIPSSLSCY